VVDGLSKRKNLQRKKALTTWIKWPTYEEMCIIRDYLHKNHVINNNSDFDFVRYCIAHVMEEFKTVLQGGLEVVEHAKQS